MKKKCTSAPPPPPAQRGFQRWRRFGQWIQDSGKTDQKCVCPPKWTGPVRLCLAHSHRDWSNSHLNGSGNVQWNRPGRLKNVPSSRVTSPVRRRDKHVRSSMNYPNQLRARRTLSQFNDVLLRTRRALSLYEVLGDNALLVHSGTSWTVITPFWFTAEHLDSDNALLVHSGTSWIVITPFWQSTDSMFVCLRETNAVSNQKSSNECMPSFMALTSLLRVSLWSFSLYITIQNCLNPATDDINYEANTLALLFLRADNISFP